MRSRSRALVPASRAISRERPPPPGLAIGSPRLRRLTLAPTLRLSESSVVPNCVAKPKGEKRTYVCDEMHAIKDISSLNLRRPVDRGYVVNWDLQKEIWSHVFSKILKIDPRRCHLVLTEAPFNLPSIAAEQDDVIFNHFGFKSALICNPGVLALADRLSRVVDKDEKASDDDKTLKPSALAARARCGVVLDAGFSFAHATPIFDDRVLRRGARRVNLGGKALTNYLKELVSYRQWNMMDEYVLVDDVKEKTCYACASAAEELKKAKVRGPANEVNREYVLPDGVHVLRGYVKEGPARDPDAEDGDDSDEDPDDEPGGKKRKRGGKKNGRGGGGGGGGAGDGDAAAPNNNKARGGGGFVEQTMTMGNERFMVPEALFHPSDVGLNQAGVAEATAQAVSATAPELRGLMFANVVLAGGCANLPGFRERFVSELRPLVPAEEALVVHSEPEPELAAWRGGSAIAAEEGALERNAATREEYLADPAAFARRYEEHRAVVKGRI